MKFSNKGFPIKRRTSMCRRKSPEIQISSRMAKKKIDFTNYLKVSAFFVNQN